MEKLKNILESINKTCNIAKLELKVLCTLTTLEEIEIEKICAKYSETQKTSLEKIEIKEKNLKERNINPKQSEYEKLTNKELKELIEYHFPLKNKIEPENQLENLIKLRIMETPKYLKTYYLDIYY